MFCGNGFNSGQGMGRGFARDQRTAVGVVAFAWNKHKIRWTVVVDFTAFSLLILLVLAWVTKQ